jgi:hypothetical protein
MQAFILYTDMSREVVFLAENPGRYYWNVLLLQDRASLEEIDIWLFFADGIATASLAVLAASIMTSVI